jgi:NADH:ubiquinone reductase (H+-translocating)
MQFNIPATTQKRVVIVGAGFAGLNLARRLSKNPDFQVVLIDRNNYHQFQPLLYQVAMAGLEPSSIVFPLRKMFQRNRNVFVRITDVQSVEAGRNVLHTGLGELHYDYLAICIGVDTNYYGNEQLRSNVIPMKSVSEALYLRNTIFDDYEKAVTANNEARKQRYLDIVIVGGGPTGVEVAGALAEMKTHIIPKDYHDLNRDEIDIHLISGSPRLLNTMSEEASHAAERFLTQMGVRLWMDKVVKDYDGETVFIDDGTTIKADKVIWAAGITGNVLPGLPAEVTGRGRRLKVNAFNQVEGFDNIFALGDIALMSGDAAFPEGHPQVAQGAIQMATLLANNLGNVVSKNKPMQPFRYKDLGSMATIGRHRAVADFPFMKAQGAFAWFAWLFVHLFSLIGAKNKLFVFLNWVSNYFTYDQSLRLVIRPWRRGE